MNDLISRQAALDAMETWDKFGCDQDGKLVRCDDDKHYIPYVHYEDMVHAIKHLPSAQPEQRWIPVTERLPENEDVLIQFPSNMAVGRYCGEWRINSGGNWETEICVDDEKPIAWMPLPEPYRKEGEEG